MLDERSSRRNLELCEFKDWAMEIRFQWTLCFQSIGAIDVSFLLRLVKAASMGCSLFSIKGAFLWIGLKRKF